MPPEEIAYHLELFHSVETMMRHVTREGWHYFFCGENGRILGYLAFKPERERMFLSKAYLKKEARGRGRFNDMLEFTEKATRAAGLASIYLKVNPCNAPALAIYHKKGFQIVRQMIEDIGNGFKLPAIEMEKRL